MKTRILLAALLAGLITSVPATVVSTGAMRYPVNLGPKANPNRIPVGWIPCESNHGYGVVELIGFAYPSVPGGWKWDGGLELNGNLASAFGISVEPEDSTNVPGSPVVIRVRKQAKPAYSPYSKEQVLLATLRCLLDTVRATPKNPLVVKVVAEDAEDEALQRFSGEYLTRPLPDDPFEETVLPGCWVEVGLDGQREIVFKADDDVEKAKRAPGWYPFPVEGDGESAYLLLPAWPGNGFEGLPLELLGRPWPVVQDRFNPTVGSPDGNLVTRRELAYSFGAGKTEEAHTLVASLTLLDEESYPEEIAMLCWAAVLTAQPTEDLPLEITLRMGREVDPRFQDWVVKSGWEEVLVGAGRGIRTTLVWNPGEAKLTTGAIPGLQAEPMEGGGWDMVTDADLAARLEGEGDDAEALPEEEPGEE